MTGNTGPAGLRGDTGAAGAAGVKGDTGVASYPWINGDNDEYHVIDTSSNGLVVRAGEDAAMQVARAGNIGNEGDVVV